MIQNIKSLRFVSYSVLQLMALFCSNSRANQNAPMLNQHGYGVINFTGELTHSQKKFLKSIQKMPDAVVADVGSGFGEWSKVLVRNGAKHVYAIDVSQDHLTHMLEHLPDDQYQFKQTITPVLGRFPRDPKFKSLFSEERFSVIFCQYLLQFLTGKEIEEAFDLFYKGLKPGGVVAIWSGSLKGHKAYLSYYTQREQQGYAYPGECDDMDIVTPELRKHIPNFHHFLLPDTLADIAKKRGFSIQTVKYENNIIVLIAEKRLFLKSSG